MKNDKLYSFTTKQEADNFLIEKKKKKGLLTWNNYFNCWLFMQGTMDDLACILPNGRIIEHYTPLKKERTEQWIIKEEKKFSVKKV